MLLPRLLTKRCFLKGKPRLLRSVVGIAGGRQVHTNFRTIAVQLSPVFLAFTFLLFRSVSLRLAEIRMRAGVKSSELVKYKLTSYSQAEANDANGSVSLLRFTEEAAELRICYSVCLAGVDCGKVGQCCWVFVKVHCHGCVVSFTSAVASICCVWLRAGVMAPFTQTVRYSPAPQLVPGGEGRWG